jgi:hypothetical protein
MICADFLAGASIDGGNPETLLQSISRYYKFLPSPVCSIFSQILQLISRTGFDTAVRKHKAERHARGFSSWGQFVAMMFCQLGGAKSLREICGGLAASEGKLSRWRRPAWCWTTTVFSLAMR